MLVLKKPVIINCKNYVLIWKSKKQNAKIYSKDPATVATWYKLLGGAK